VHVVQADVHVGVLHGLVLGDVSWFRAVNMGHNADAKESPGNRKWFLEKVVEMCEEDDG